MTLLRVWVLFAQILITTILTGALISIFNKNFHLFKYCVVATTILYILFAFARPANLVARYNLSDAFDEEDIDFYYIENHLNSDAAPALKAYAKRNHTKVRYMVDWDDDMGFRGFNISRYYLEKVR